MVADAAEMDLQNVSGPAHDDLSRQQRACVESHHDPDQIAVVSVVWMTRLR